MKIGTQKKLLAAALAAVLLAGCGGAEERKAKYLERGKAFIAEENWDKARVEIKNVLQIDPKSAEAYFLLGRVEENKQEWSKSFGAYSKAVELDPNMIEARSRLAQFYLLQANVYRSREERDGEAKALGQAQKEIEEIFKRDAKHPGARALQASMRLREGKTEEAMALAEAAVKDDPSNGPAAGLLASLYEQAGKIEDAENVLVAAAAKAEDPIPLNLHLAQMYARQKNNIAAEKALRDIVAKRPDELNHRVQLAQFLAQTDQIDKAEVVLREAVSEKPDEANRYLMLAGLLRSKKGLPAAIEYLQQSVKEKPELSELRFGLANFLELDKKVSEAKKVYEEAVAHFGDEPAGLQARNRLALHAAAEGDSEGARKLTEYVIEKNPRDKDALLMQGRLAMQRSDFDTAVAAFRAVLKDQPESVPLLHLLAEAQLRNGDTELAGDSLRRAVEVAPTDAGARISYAHYLITRKELVRALEQVDAVLQKDPANADAIAAKSEVLAAKGDLEAVKAELLKLKEATPDNPEASLRLARVLMAEGNVEAAKAEVEAVLAKDDKNLAALMLKTDLLAAANDAAGLEAAIKRIKAVAPDNPDGYFRMGRFYRAKGDVAGELKEYERAYSLAKAQAKSTMLNEIVNTHLRAGQSEQALARVEAVLREEPDHPAANALIGNVQMARKDYKAAEAAFNKQLQFTPNAERVYVQLAAARELQGDKPGAVAAYEQGLGVLKEDVGLLTGLAGVYERQGNVDAAIEIYEKVLAKQPDNAISVNNLAALLADHRTDDKSLARAKELAAKLEPVQQPAMRDTLGWVQYRAGDYAKAVEVLEGVVNAAPEVPIFQYHLGMAYAKAGDKAKAKAALSKAVDLGDFAEAEDARKALAGL